MSLKYWLQQVALANHRMAERRLLKGFAAAYPLGLEIRQGIIHDISATGIYLQTRDRLEPGTLYPLTLHRIGLLVAEARPNFVTINARVLRSDEEGVAFAFEIPSDLDAALWTNLLDTATAESDSDDIVAPFKMARAFAFLMRICAPAGTRVRERIRAAIKSQRLWNAIEIALQAESYLAACGEPASQLCEPSLSLRILEEGSWNENEAMMHDRAGLLATACAPGKRDAKNCGFVDLFSQLTLTHVRILNEACRRGEKYFTPDGQVASRPITATSDEIMHVSDTRTCCAWDARSSFSPNWAWRKSR